MAVDFRCENCGKLLSLEAEPGTQAFCPHCNKVIVVPAGLASLPRPQVPPNGRPAAGPPTPATPTEMEPQGEREVFVSAMAQLMPFVISVFFHLGLLLVFWLITLAVIETGVKAPDVVVPDAFLSETPGGVMTPREVTMDPSDRATKPTSRSPSAVENPIPADAGKTTRRLLIGADGAPAGEGKNWLARGGGDSGGPRSSFMGTGGRAYHIIWVVDRSGSMHDTFDIVAKEMTISIGRLQAVQDFHVIFFSTGQPVENPPKRLVPATAANKLDAGEFLGGVIPQGKTDPIPALQRAFEVLKRADPARPGKLIYLLTDGDFPNSAEVLRSIRERNAKKEIHINTYLYQYRGEHAVSVMRQIADQNNGKYKYVSADE